MPFATRYIDPRYRLKAKNSILMIIFFFKKKNMIELCEQRNESKEQARSYVGLELKDRLGFVRILRHSDLGL